MWGVHQLPAIRVSHHSQVSGSSFFTINDLNVFLFPNSHKRFSTFYTFVWLLNWFVQLIASSMSMEIFGVTPLDVKLNRA